MNDLAMDEVRLQLTEQLPAHIFYHNENYLEQVVDAARQLAEEAGLEKEETEQLELAAIFQSVRHLHGGEKPWEASAKAATEFLLRNNANPDTVNAVDKLIHSLDPAYQPETTLEKLFLDATEAAYGDKKFLERADRLRKEEEAHAGNNLEEIEWTGQLLERMKDHAFRTSQAESLFGKRKEKNLKKITKGLQSNLKVKLEGDKSSSISANSGARTMFKTALRNHVDLTSIADQKANIMLSINALIITIGLPAFATYLSGKPVLIVPGVMFLFTSIATMIVATLSTRPIKVDGYTDLSKLKTGKTNLFFFGNFYKLPNDDYREAIKEIVADREHLDSSFVNDLYYLGVSLGEKFRLLRLCYTIFVIGLCLTVLSFVVAYFVAGGN